MMEEGYLHEKRTFGKTPALLIHDHAITDGAVRLYAHMHWRYGANCANFEGQQSMAESLGVSRATISKRIKELEAHDWIVVVERQNRKSGNYTTPIYHVFTDQDECRAWRSSPAIADTERVREKSDVDARKTRKGVGGNPNLNDRDNSALHGHRVNSSLHGRVNSSLHYLESVDLEKSIVDANASTPRAKELPPPAYDKPAGPLTLYASLFAVVAEGLGMDANEISGGRIGQIAKWLCGGYGGPKHRKVKELPFPAQPQHVVKFFAWWKQTYGEASPPRDLEKWTEHWSAFGKAQQKRQRQTAARVIEPIRTQADVTLTDEDRAEIARIRAQALAQLNGDTAA